MVFDEHLPEVERSEHSGEDIHPAPAEDVKLVAVAEGRKEIVTPSLLKLQDLEQIQELSGKYSKIRAAKVSDAKFAASLLSPRSWFVDLEGQGIVYLTGVSPRFEAIASFAFWDMKISAERRALVQGVLAAGMERFDLKRLSAFVPASNKALVYAFKKIGFQVEGNMRESFLFEDKRLDLIILGLLRNEVSWPAIEVG